MTCFGSIDLYILAGDTETPCMGLGESRVFAVELIGPWPATTLAPSGATMAVMLTFRGAFLEQEIRDVRWRYGMAPYSVTAGPDCIVALDPGVLLACRYLSVVMSIPAPETLDLRLLTVIL